MRQAQVYTLIDPQNLTVRYVGGTICLLDKRLSNHISSARQNKSNVHLCAWINELRNIGLNPIITLICICDTEDFTDDETTWIWFLSECCGCDLLNVLDGGQLGFTSKHSNLSKKRMSKTRKGKPHPHKGHKITYEVKEQIRQSNLGLKRTEETKKNISLAKKGKTSPNKGKKFSDEVRKNMSIGHLGQKAWNKGLKASDEARLNMSLAHKKKANLVVN